MDIWRRSEDECAEEEKKRGLLSIDDGKVFCRIEQTWLDLRIHNP
jgi:hypothetical protein